MQFENLIQNSETDAHVGATWRAGMRSMGDGWVPCGIRRRGYRYRLCERLALGVVFCRASSRVSIAGIHVCCRPRRFCPHYRTRAPGPMLFSSWQGWPCRRCLCALDFTRFVAPEAHAGSRANFLSSMRALRCGRSMRQDVADSRAAGVSRLCVPCGPSACGARVVVHSCVVNCLMLTRA